MSRSACRIKGRATSKLVIWVTFVFSRVDEAGPDVASWHAVWIRERGTRWKTRRVRFASVAVGSSRARRTSASLLLVPSCGEPASVRERYGVVHIGRLEGKARLPGLDFIGFRSQYYFMPRHASPGGNSPSSWLRKIQRSRLFSLDFAAFALRHCLLASRSRWGQVCFAPVSEQNKKKKLSFPSRQRPSCRDRTFPNVCE